ncbi:MAG: hypothetical protein M3Y64_04075, partial [Gemmatimonadota bacterium]|nr:hypothetical protein [Gemmatimonadota bacterium]
GLGANDVIEAFPVGRRLAFDEKTGRLWVVCKSCGHWNLSPMEERWEAVENCERLYRETRTRAATDNIGLAKLNEGLDLVRIGKPLRPEFAAWRYGPRMVARQRKAALWAVGGAIVTVGGVVVVAGVAISALSVFAFSTVGVGLFRAGEVGLKVLEDREYERVVAHVTDERGHRYGVRKKHLRLISLEPDDGPDGWRLSVHRERGQMSLTGMHAKITAGNLMAHLNAKGASKATVQYAAERISEVGDTEQFIRNAISLRDKRRQSGQLMKDSKLDSFGLRYEERLAVEMAMHEDAERSAMQGELAALEQAWRDAEEIGSIADNMFE